ncbi:MAG TPA: MaoC/PaaZ C-terminal domain-containing protein [Opitutaceae bacterium]
MNDAPGSKSYINNKTFEEMNVDDEATLHRVLSRDDILLFAAVSGDVNPAHVDEEFARSDFFQKIIAHGMWGAALISTVLGTELPGPGTIYLGQTLRFKKPVSIGDRIATTVTVKEKNPAKGRVIFHCQCRNQCDEEVISGEAEVLAPQKKISRPRKSLPEVKLIERFARDFPQV